MNDRDRAVRRVSVVRLEDENPQYNPGLLIPAQRGIKWSMTEDIPDLPTVTPRLDLTVFRVVLIPVFMFLFALSAAATGGYYVYSTTDFSELMAAPIVVVENPYTNEVTPLNYGVQLALSQPNFYDETHAAFIEDEMTFIEADLHTMQLRFFKDGVLVDRAPILSKGKEGSWWETPAGLYKIEFKKENHFSSFGQVYQPWSMAFQGNFFIHGWPAYPDGTPVPEGYSGGCIRLADEDAQRIFEQVTVDTPVLVHERQAEADAFVYEPKVPELETEHYLIADIESSTVLASSDLSAASVPIASLTKLMTALVAAEYINLDTDVWVSQPTFVQSLIPRLSGRSRVSMYSLLQLLLVESSNEAAEVIAAQVGRARFIALMNEKAQAIGMTETTFADPSGLEAGNVSTVDDLLRLTQYIFTNRSFIFELTANQDLPTAYVSGEFGQLVNFNQVTELDNFIGGKIGETEAAGQTSITLHRLWVKDEPRTLAIILLGSEHRNDDVKELFTYALDRFGH